MKIAFYIIESVLYLICLACINKKIFDVNIFRKERIFFIAVIYSFLIVIINILDFDIFLYAFQAIQILQILALSKKSTFKKILATYVFIYSISMILSITLRCIVYFTDFVFLIVDLMINVSIFTLCIIFCFNKRICEKIKKILECIPDSIICLTVISLFVSAVLMSLIMINPYLSLNNSWNIMVRISLVLLSLFVCTTFPLLIIITLSNSYLKAQNEAFQRDIEAQAKHYSDLAKANYELRRFKHDFNNIKIGLEKTLSDNDCEEALSILKNGNYNAQTASAKMLEFDTGNGIVDALLSDKQSKADKYHTKIVFSGSVPPRSIAPTDLCVLFGNTLDNAIEACEKFEDDTEKIVSVSCKCNSGFAFISITNPVVENVPVSKNSVASTKADKASHGYGLYSLNKTVKKLGGSLNISCSDNVFKVEIDVYLEQTAMYA